MSRFSGSLKMHNRLMESTILSQTRVFIATHKAYPFPAQENYVPIHAGHAVNPIDLGIICDDSGDNISALNPYFCELTVLYWLWKHCNAQIQGLVHYRRYFTHPTWTVQHCGYPILDASKLAEILPTPQHIILPEPYTCGIKNVLGLYTRPRTVYEHYRKFHHKKDWAILEQVLAKHYPSYIPALHIVKNSTQLHFFNMFVAHKPFVENYCHWLFTILFQLSEHINPDSYSPYQARVFGFLAERLLNIYIQHHKTEYLIHTFPVIFLE